MMQPGLNGAHFFFWFWQSALAKKIAGMEDGLSCPN